MGLFDGKTEAPTAKRLEDARKKGQFAKSRDVIAVAVLIAGVSALRTSGPRVFDFLQHQMVFYLTEAMRPDRLDALKGAGTKLVTGAMTVLSPVIGAMVTAAIVSNVSQTGPVLLATGLKADFSKISPLAGLKRMISPAMLGELAKGLAKVGFVGWQVYGWMRDSYPGILEMAHMELTVSAPMAASKIAELVWRTLSVLTTVAAVDYAWQRFQYTKSLMMTKQDIKDEFRMQEGSPEIRGAIRRRQREMARSRMMAAVPTADVVITNPTHYAVALKYDPDGMEAPHVVALGQRLTALRIRELAREHDVPIVENPPLARALYAACDVGSEVPPELYAAVAEVLAYVYRLSGRGFGRN